MSTWILLALVVPAIAPPASSEPSGSGGTGIWIARYTGSKYGSDRALAMVVSPDGSKVFVTGESDRPPDGFPDYATVGYDALTGVQLWVKRVDGPGDFEDAARGISSSPDGSVVFVTGESWGDGTSFDYATFAYDADTGVVVWATRFGRPGNVRDSARAVATSPDGSKVFVTGESAQDFATIAYEASTGAFVWASRFDGPAHLLDTPRAMAVSPDGRTVFVTGTTYEEGGIDQNFATIAYDAETGARLWAKRYEGPGQYGDRPTAIATSPDGSKVFVTGDSDGGVGVQELNYATVAYGASDGAQSWVRRYDGPGGFGDQANGLAVSPDGAKVYITGSVDSGGFDYDWGTFAYDASSGTTLWRKRFDGPGDSVDAASSIAASPDGSLVFVTGAGTDGTGFGNTDYATIAYEASTGGVVWVQRYDGPGHSTDEASSIDLSPDGTKVFVTGTSIGAASADYATIAYEA